VVACRLSGRGMPRDSKTLVTEPIRERMTGTMQLTVIVLSPRVSRLSKWLNNRDKIAKLLVLFHGQHQVFMVGLLQHAAQLVPIKVCNCLQLPVCAVPAIIMYRRDGLSDTQLSLKCTPEEGALVKHFRSFSSVVLMTPVDAKPSLTIIFQPRLQPPF